MADIDVVEVTEDRDDLLDALALVRAATEGEINPDDEPAPVVELAGDLFERRIDVRRRGWLAFLDGEPAGELIVAVETDEANSHIAQGEWLAVRPDRRRCGVADALLRHVLPVLAGEGATSLVLSSPVLPHGAGEAYATRCGLTLRMEERCSRLLVGEHDADLVEQWVAEGRSRTDGYRLVQYLGPCPDEHLDALVAAHVAMEDMPTDDMEWTIPTMTPEKLRSRDEAWAERGVRGVSTLVLAPDGSAAGLSELGLNVHRPQIAWQMDTGVVGAHRGHGLGRWLKAENLRLALETEPRVRVVETYNAQTNPWMLDINVAMGFRPHVRYQVFQGDLAGACAAVGA